MEAICGIADMYEDGQVGVAQSFTQAMTWWREAAAAGSTEAMYNIGRLYFNGQGVPRNYPYAVRWYRKAAARGNNEAILNIACIYECGERGVPRNHREAVAWFRRLAKSNQSVFRQAANTALARLRTRVR